MGRGVRVVILHVMILYQMWSSWVRWYRRGCGQFGCDDMLVGMVFVYDGTGVGVVSLAVMMQH